MELRPLKLKYIYFSVKYLGVKPTDESHTNYLVNIASSRLGFVCRVIPYTRPRPREKVHKTLARPFPEYSSAVWDSSLTQTQSTKVKSVPQKAARVVYSILKTDHTTATIKIVSTNIQDYITTIHIPAVLRDMHCSTSYHTPQLRSTRRHFSSLQLNC